MSNSQTVKTVADSYRAMSSPDQNSSLTESAADQQLAALKQKYGEYSPSHPGHSSHPHHDAWLQGRSEHDIANPPHRNPDHNPGEHNPMSLSHASMKLTRQQHAKHIAGESGQVKKMSTDAHKLSDHADSLKHVMSNHAQLIKHHNAAAEAHSTVGAHFANLEQQHGGHREANDTSGTWHDSSGYGGTHWQHNTPEAHHYGQLRKYHDDAAKHHNRKAYGAESGAKHATAMKTSFSAKSATAKKGALTRARDHKRNFEYSNRNKDLASHMSSEDRY